MIYASSTAAIYKALSSTKFTMIQASDESELDHKDLLEKLSDKYTK